MLGKVKKTKVIIATNISFKNCRVRFAKLLKTQNNFGIKPHAIIIIG